MSFDIFDYVTDILSINISAIDYKGLVKTFDESSHGNINISRAVAPGERRLLQYIWDLRIGRDDFFSSPLFPVILSVTFYFSFCMPFMIFDLLGERWKWMHKFKLQPEFKVDTSHLLDTLGVTFWNHILFILPAACAQWVWTPPTVLPELAPTVLEFVWHQFAGMLVFDFQYFVWHWSHHKIRFLYKHVHSIHHRYNAPFIWVTQYLHPWELITVGFITTTNMWFFNSHPLTVWSFMVLNIVVSVEAHIGYDFPFTLNHLTFGILGGAPKHDMHHLKPMTNFEPFFNHWDRICDTFCPPMEAGGVKPANLKDYERKQKETKKLQ